MFFYLLKITSISVDECTVDGNRSKMYYLYSCHPNIKSLSLTHRVLCEAKLVFIGGYAWFPFVSLLCSQNKICF